MHPPILMQDPGAADVTAGEASDASLVCATRRGEIAAFGILVERHWRMAVGLVFSRIADAAEAEDVAQESFLRAYTRLHTLRDPARFAGWLSKIALQQAANALRKRRRQRNVLADCEIAREHSELPAADAPPPGLTESQVLVVRQAVGDLPEKLRTSIVMRFVAGLSSTEIAEQLGQRPGTVRIWLHRAYKILRTELAPLLGEIHL